MSSGLAMGQNPTLGCAAPGFAGRKGPAMARSCRMSPGRLAGGAFFATTSAARATSGTGRGGGPGLIGSATVATGADFGMSFRAATAPSSGWSFRTARRGGSSGVGTIGGAGAS